jgi:mono/diheme cytochrome c family protein
MKAKENGRYALAAVTIALLGFAVAGVYASPGAEPGQTAAAGEVTFTRDIAPILQRSCQNCHRPDSVAPMALLTYEDARPWARSIKMRTGLGPKMGVMPPWFIEKNIGIQQYKDDPSLSDDEIAKIAQWADKGAPRGNPADMPPPRKFESAEAWNIGTPDLIVMSPEVVVKAGSPDWWGELENVPTGLTEDRYVSAVEVKEINDIPKKNSGQATVGGRYVFHHLIWGLQAPSAGLDLAAGAGAGWPIHEVGRNADVFDPRAGKLMRAGSILNFTSIHLHANGNDTKAHLAYGFKFHPKGYKPTLVYAQRSLGNGVDIDIKPNEANQQLHAYTVLQQHTKITSFEPHLHAPGARMCLEAIWGSNIQTLTCAGYDHNWVRIYEYAEDAAPLLPKGTILHVTGYMDNSVSNKNITDPRNWQGSGNRSVANMFIDLGQGVALSDEEFLQEMAKRRAKVTRNDLIIGCPLCMVAPPQPPTAPAGNNQ